MELESVASSRRHALAAAVGLVAASLAMATPAAAAPPPISAPFSAQQPGDNSTQSAGFLGDLNRTSFLLGDLFGLRTDLSKIGVSLAIQETSEVLGNASGGAKRGAEYDGLTQAILQLDTQRAFGWYGGLFNVSGLELHGRNLSAESLLSLQTSSGIEGDRAARLWELWYDQKLLPEDRLDIKVGQQSIDQEFILNPNGAYFVNTMFGWPMVPSADLPGGGPAYPLSALGVRFRWRPINKVAILAGVYNGSPTSVAGGDSQATNPSGVSFPVRGGTLALLELQFTYPALGAMVYPGQGAPLGHTYKIGVWYNSERFGDLRLDNNGVPLAAPASSGLPLQHTGDYSLYAVADQMVWRNAAKPNQSVSVFGRAMYTPQGDRNLVDFSLNAGVVFHDPLPNRPDDTVGLGMGFAHVSRTAQAYDRDVAALTQITDPGSYYPIRGGETYIEATYQYQVHPWWQVQPDIQYIINPGGGILNPNAPDQKVRNEWVLGLRTNVLF
jgi:porin